MQIYGNIINLTTNDEYFWCEASAEEVRNDLSNLRGFEYGVDWEISGDVFFEEFSIFVDVGVESIIFDGAEAVSNLYDAIGGQ